MIPKGHGNLAPAALLQETLMTTALAEPRKSVAVDCDPVPEWVQRAQASWEECLKAHRVFEEVCKRGASRMRETFPSDPAFGDYRKFFEGVVGPWDKFEEVVHALVWELVSKAVELFSDGSVRIKIKADPYEAKVKKQITRGKHDRDLWRYEDADFCEIWRELETEFGGVKGKTKISEDAAEIMKRKLFMPRTGWQERRDMIGAKKWREKVETRKKNFTVLKIWATAEASGQNDEGKWLYEYKYDTKRELVGWFHDSLQVVLKRLEIPFSGMDFQLINQHLEGRRGWCSGAVLELDNGIKIINRKERLEIQIPHAVMDEIESFMRGFVFGGK